MLVRKNSPPAQVVHEFDPKLTIIITKIGQIAEALGSAQLSNLTLSTYTLGVRVGMSLNA